LNLDWKDMFKDVVDSCMVINFTLLWCSTSLKITHPSQLNNSHFLHPDGQDIYSLWSWFPLSISGESSLNYSALINSCWLPWIHDCSCWVDAYTVVALRLYHPAYEQR
jgi:hypothetical protein